MYVNRLAERFLGKTGDELIGCKLWDAVPQLAGGRLEEECRQAIAQSKLRFFEEPNEKLGGWWGVASCPGPRWPQHLLCRHHRTKEP